MKIATRSHRRGFASTVFVSMILLAAVAATSLTVLFATEARRTKDARIHAQQRQLLLVGALQAQQSAVTFTGNSALIPVKLPAALTDKSASLTLTLTPGEAGSLHADIKATVDGQVMRQTITLIPLEGRWNITSATLIGLQ